MVVREILGMIGEEIADALASADAAQRVLELPERPSLGERLGHEGQEHVRRNFLITSYRRDRLQVMQAVSNGSSK